jgi:transcriptional regulator with XRE-family HTH domain
MQEQPAVRRFGEKLRILRKRHGLSQRELAEALGYVSATAYISDFETGKRKPTLEMVLKVADFFGVSLDQLARDDLEVDGEP